MAGGMQMANGKAFEYACIIGLFNALRDYGEIEIKTLPQ